MFAYQHLHNFPTVKSRLNRRKDDWFLRWHFNSYLIKEPSCAQCFHDTVLLIPTLRPLHMLFPLSGMFFLIVLLDFFPFSVQMTLLRALPDPYLQWLCPCLLSAYSNWTDSSLKAGALSFDFCIQLLGSGWHTVGL